MRVVRIFSLLAFAATLACVVWLSLLEEAGPERREVELEDGAPATLYLPGAADPTSPGVRPPAIVLAHGFASDRRGMSALARTLAHAGYAVLAPDLAGHGGNRNPFSKAQDRDKLVADIARAVAFLRASPEIDSARISVMGHSMGASAVYAYASRDARVDAAVMISSGSARPESGSPRNALFVYAEGDPERVHARAADLASKLSAIVGEPRAMPGEVYGRFDDGTAVSHIEVARTNHVTILGSQYASRHIIGWLDSVYGSRRGTFFVPADARLRTALLGLLSFVLVLPGLGLLLGRLAPRLAEREGKEAFAGLAALALVLVAALPFASLGAPGALIPLVLADVVAAHLFLTGVVLLLWQLFTGRLTRSDLLDGGARSIAVATFGSVIVYFGMTPFGVPLHQLGLTPERFLAALLLALLFTPFQLAFHHLLRRGSPARAACMSLLGRALILAVLVLGVRVGVLSGVVMLMLPIFAMLFVLIEVLATSIYAVSRSFVAPALLEAAWLAWIFAAVLPITW